MKRKTQAKKPATDTDGGPSDLNLKYGWTVNQAPGEASRSMVTRVARRSRYAGSRRWAHTYFSDLTCSS